MLSRFAAFSVAAVLVIAPLCYAGSQELYLNLSDIRLTGINLAWLADINVKAALTTLFAILVIYGVIVYRSDPLRDIPGPWLAKWTDLWSAYQCRMGRKYLAVDGAHKKYGPFVRIGPKAVSIADKDALQVVYGQGSAAMDKSEFYHAFTSAKASVFSTTDRQEHAQKRRLVSQAFSYKALQSLVPFIQDTIIGWVSQLDTFCREDEYFDALVWFHYLAFDVLSDLSFGETIGMVEKGSDRVMTRKADGSYVEENAISLVDEREHFSCVLGYAPRLKYYIKYIPDPFFSKGRDCSNGLKEFARERVLRRLNSIGDRDDLLNKLIEARIADGATLDSEKIDELVGETMTLLIAGSDTTSNSMAGIVHLVVSNPRVHQKLLAELDKSFDRDELPSHDRVKDLPYLLAVIEEGLRVYATTALGLPRVVPKGGVICCAKFFPEGTDLSVPAYTIQHDPSIWGDPENFRPERWHETKDLKKYLLTFAMGPRACLGRNLAYIEMQVALASLFLRYDIQLQSEVLETVEGFMHKPIDLRLKLKRRLLE